MTTTTKLRIEALNPPTTPGLHLALQRRTDVEDPRPVVGEAMVLEADVAIVDADGQPDFRGPYVQGPKGDRFVYLVWGSMSGGELTRNGRTKIILDEIPRELLREAAAGSERRLEASFEATVPGGGPLTGRVRPDIVRWSVERVET